MCCCYEHSFLVLVRFCSYFQLQRLWQYKFNASIIHSSSISPNPVQPWKSSAKCTAALKYRSCSSPQVKAASLIALRATNKLAHSSYLIDLRIATYLSHNEHRWPTGYSELYPPRNSTASWVSPQYHRRYSAAIAQYKPQ